MLIALGAGLATWLSLAAPSPADAGSAVVGGRRMSCYAAEVIQHDSVPGPGFSVEGTILLGPKYLKAYPPIVQRLVFLHECGHQYVGTDESAADCWAVRTAKRQGWLTPQGLRQACRALWHTVGDGAHLSGPERCAALQQCYATAPGARKAKARKSAH